MTFLLDDVVLYFRLNNLENFIDYVQLGSPS